MRDVGEQLFEDESLSGDEAAVDDAIRAAGGDPRVAVRALLVALAEAQAALAATSSLGYRRGRQPGRRMP